MISDHHFTGGYSPLTRPYASGLEDGKALSGDPGSPRKSLRDFCVVDVESLEYWRGFWNGYGLAPF